MLYPTDGGGMTLSIMLSIYARKAKDKPREGAAQFAMYAFYDAVERTAVAFNQVLDGKRSPSEAHDILIDYAKRLEEHLNELDAGESDGSLQGVDVRPHAEAAED